MCPTLARRASEESSLPAPRWRVAQRGPREELWNSSFAPGACLPRRSASLTLRVGTVTLSGQRMTKHLILKSAVWVCLAALWIAFGAVAQAGDPAQPIVPREPIRLFNGRDFSGLVTWLKDSGRDDPKTVFSVEDGVLHISGDGAGYIATERSYKNYRVHVEYKWGRKADGSGFVRNSGVLLHKVGADRIWPTCIEVQLAQGCEGDFIVIPGVGADGKPGAATMTCETRLESDRRTRWQAGGTKTKYSGKQFWWSQHEPGFKELLDTRGKDDVASPVGMWTQVECLCRDNRITVKINGVTVNEGFDVSPAAGQILLQNEGNEIYFRNFELHPLDP